MLKKLIKGYNTAKIKALATISADAVDLNAEISFYDEGIVASKILKLQERYNKLVNEKDFITEYNNNDDKQRYLNDEMINIENSIAFWLTTINFKNLDTAYALAKKNKINFQYAILGLKEYKENNNIKALEYISKYLECNDIDNHFLLNKVYGILLLPNDTAKAKRHLIIALKLNPVDKELYSLLKYLYSDDVKKLKNIIQIEDILEVRQ